MTQKQIEQWARIRAKGPAHFIGLRGIVGVGVGMTAGFYVTTVLVYGWERAASELPNDLALFAGVGLVTAMLLWYFSERSYKRAVGPNVEK